MSARDRLVGAALAALAGKPSLAPLTVFDAPPVRAAMPFAVIEEPVLAAWDMSGAEGFEGRLVVTATDDGERPVRLRALLDRVEAMLAAMPADLGEGWRIARLTLGRSRIVRAWSEGQMRWIATSDFQVRVYRTLNQTGA